MWLGILCSHCDLIRGDLAAQTIGSRLVPCCSDKSNAAFGLSSCEARSDFFEYGKMLVDVGFGVLDGDGPLLVPPVRHGEYAAVDHAEPELAPEVHIDFRPV